MVEGGPSGVESSLGNQQDGKRKEKIRRIEIEIIWNCQKKGRSVKKILVNWERITL